MEKKIWRIKKKINVNARIFVSFLWIFQMSTKKENYFMIKINKIHNNNATNKNKKLEIWNIMNLYAVNALEKNISHMNILTN